MGIRRSLAVVMGVPVLALGIASCNSEQEPRISQPGITQDQLDSAVNDFRQRLVDGKAVKIALKGCMLGQTPRGESFVTYNPAIVNIPETNFMAVITNSPASGHRRNPIDDLTIIPLTGPQGEALRSDETGFQVARFVLGETEANLTRVSSFRRLMSAREGVLEPELKGVPALISIGVNSPNLNAEATQEICDSLSSAGLSQKG